jgi:hypothetical protein
LYSRIGFGAAFLGALLFGVTLDQFGGISQLAAWIVSFGTCGLACLDGAAATTTSGNDRDKLPARCLTKKPGW